MYGYSNVRRLPWLLLAAGALVWAIPIDGGVNTFVAWALLLCGFLAF